MSWIILLGIIVSVVGLTIYFTADPHASFTKTAGQIGWWSLIIWSCCAGWMLYDPKKI